MINQISPIAILGAGSWGTALAIHLARAHQEVRLWAHTDSQAKKLQTERSNEVYLLGCKFPDNLVVSNSLATCLKDCSDILLVVPSHAFRDTIHLIKPFITSNSRLVWATKGLDPHRNILLSEVCHEILGNSIPLAVLSGPSFASELAQGLPTAITLSSTDISLRDSLVQRFHHGALRVYANNDLIGTQLGGAVKNVLAIAAGISDGLGFGANAKAAIITRGVAEMERLVSAMGGQHNTVMGLAGIGDLVLTCTDDKSRNRRFGMLIGKGVSVDKALEQIKQVVEGFTTAQQVYQLAQRYQVDMPITTQVYGVLYQHTLPLKAVETLFARQVKQE